MDTLQNYKSPLKLLDFYFTYFSSNLPFGQANDFEKKILSIDINAPYQGRLN